MPKIEGISRNYQFYIGIDCGVNTGLACWWKKEKQLSCVTTVKIHVAMDLIRQWHRTRGGMLVRVEDARQATWMRNGDVHKAQGAGSVMRDASIWEGFLEDLGVDYEMVRPRKEFTKWKEDAFKSLTKFEGRTSEHARDAALLVYGL